jgi:putative flippase GtrA
MTTDQRIGVSNMRPIEAIRRRLAALSRFSFVGLVATGVYLVVSNGIMAAGLAAPAWASLIAYFAGMFFSFLGQSQFTFRIGRIIFSQVVRFCVLSAWGIAMSYGFVYALVVYAKFNGLAATIITTGIIALFNFIVMNNWVFRPAGDV